VSYTLLVRLYEIKRARIGRFMAGFVGRAGIGQDMIPERSASSTIPMCRGPPAASHGSRWP